MKYLFLSLLIFLTVLSNAQTSSAPKLPKKLIRISTPKLNALEEDSLVLVLKMEFNGAVPKSRLEKVKIKDIESVSLVYSRYKLSEMFDQLTLNAQRMDRLYALVPGLKENTNIQWYWVEQTGCDDPDACNDYFHGFVVKMKSESDRLERTTEDGLMAYYTSLYEGEGDTKKMDSIVTTLKLKMLKKCDTFTVRVLNKRNRLARIRGWNTENNKKMTRLLKEELKDSGIVHLEITMEKDGKFLAFENSDEFSKSSKILRLLEDNLTISPATYNGKRIRSFLTVTIESGSDRPTLSIIQQPILPNNEEFNMDKFLYSEKTSIVCDYIDTAISTKKAVSFNSTPDIIFKVFNRNRQWKNCLVATDVTGSMFPYLAQFKVWHKLHLNAFSGNHDFVFFNDGDNMSDQLKVTGQVGGIYYVNTAEYEKLSALMKMAMTNGGGGDCPENNIEAVLVGLKNNPDCKEVIMIADNHAIPRDLAILKKVNVPIRLILCGAQHGINTAYLDLVRTNKGSIHTMEQDVYDLAKMSNNKEVELDGHLYRLQDEKFVEIKTQTKTDTTIKVSSY
jgi:hypothetical protein